MEASTPRNDDPISRSISFATGLDPGFADVLEPATADDIAELQALTGNPPAPMHLAFLRHMGRNADWLQLRRVDFSIEAVIRFLAEDRWRPPTSYALIGIDEGESACHAYLQDHGDTQPVVGIPDLEGLPEEELGKWIGYEAGSLPELICRQALRMFVINPMPWRSTLTMRDANAGVLDTVGRIAAFAGLEKLWFSTSFGVHCRGEDLALSATQPPGYAMAIAIGAATEAARNQLVAALCGELDLLIKA